MTKKRLIQKIAFVTFGLVSLMVVGILFAILGFIAIRGLHGKLGISLPRCPRTG
ncbi:MAG: hypothetical protein U0Z17_10460 [Bacteroidales bacterium]